MRTTITVTVGLATALIAMSGLVGSADAGAPLSEYSCKELWLERNGILANKGHCFTSARGITAFGKRCYPPYGKLSASERKAVAKIRMWESRKGC